MRTDNDNNNKNERNIKADRNKVMRPRKKGLFYFPRFLLQGYKKIYACLTCVRIYD